MPAPHYLIFTSQMLFMMPNQQCPSTESKTCQHLNPDNNDNPLQNLLVNNYCTFPFLLL